MNFLMNRRKIGGRGDVLVKYFDGIVRDGARVLQVKNTFPNTFILSRASYIIIKRQ